MRWTRFKSLLLGSVIIGVGIVVIAPPLFLVMIFGGSDGISLVPLVFIIPGLALFQSNLLQYGMDQLDFASSKVLSSFVYWYY